MREMRPNTNNEYTHSHAFMNDELNAISILFFGWIMLEIKTILQNILQTVNMVSDY